MEKRKRSLAIDILNGPMWDKILRYALPVAATGILGQLFNASDIAIVGNFAEGDTVAAVAAVGANGPVIGLLLNIFIGIALGANVVIANAIGRGDKETVSRAVHTSIVAAVLGGIIVGLLSLSPSRCCQCFRCRRMFFPLRLNICAFIFSACR